MKPWDYNPEFTSERLVKVAQLLELARGDAVDRHDPEIGGDAWTRGVCAYRYGCFRITQVAETEGFEWLRVIDPGKRFQFSIGGMPMRFWRGDPQEPSARVTAPTPFEQLQLALEDTVPLGGVLFRINVTTDDDGSLLDAHFVALRSGVIDALWQIPFTGALPLIFAVDEERPEGRDIPEPLATLPDDEDLGAEQEPDSQSGPQP